MQVFRLGIVGVALLALTACSGSDSFKSERDMALADLATAQTDLDAANAALNRANRVRELFGALQEGRVILSGRNTNVSDMEVTTTEDSPIGAQVIGSGTPMTLAPVGDLMGQRWTKTVDGITDTLVLYNTQTPGHVSFGWWLREKPDGWQFSEISPIVGDDIQNAGAVDEIEGTATYTGLAAGMYSMLKGSEGGEFTAAATFTADFGAGDAPARVSGRLDDFTGADGMPRADWSVAFTEVGMNPSRGHWTNEGDAFWSVGDETSDGGHWRGFFYGRPNADILTGRFSASHPSDTGYGYMRGSFGASRD